MNLITIILSRTGSDRLPKKALLNLSNSYILEYLINRVKLAKNVENIVISTTKLPEDDIIEKICNSVRVKCYRGLTDDVLGRIKDTVEFFDADAAVIIYGDCPLIDPSIIDYVIDEYIKNKNSYDFVGNNISSTYPAGMEVEVVSRNAIFRADGIEKDISIREHGTLHVRTTPTKYKLLNIAAPSNQSFPNYAFELDEHEDFLLIKEIVSRFQDNKFSLNDMLDIINSEKDLVKINNKVHRRWKKYRL
tara:strand:+ start:1047 stop:1790 length:744 start_codon:yes stop_codon:yes gene_type:complete